VAFEDQFVLSSQPIVAVFLDQMDDAHRRRSAAQASNCTTICSALASSLQIPERLAEQAQPVAVEQCTSLRR
jgi:hypothetical protein